MGKRIEEGTMRDALTYAPGDGHRYTWRGMPKPIRVERILTSEAGEIVFVPTGDTIPGPDTQTVTAMVAAVESWRGGTS